MGRDDDDGDDGDGDGDGDDDDDDDDDDDGDDDDELITKTEYMRWKYRWVGKMMMVMMD